MIPKFKRSLAAGLLLATMCSGSAWASAPLDDATILAIFDQANFADISTARLGVKKGHSPEVKELARMVASDHEAVQQMGRDVARKIGVMPSPPDDDRSFEAQARAVAILQAKSGPEFDRAYLEHEIAFHASVIEAIKGALLPSATHRELRGLIATVLPGFEHHLAATRAAAKKLGVTYR